MDNDMMEKIELLKRELFMDGSNAIEAFIDYELDENESDDVVERRMDVAIDCMSKDELGVWFEKYGIA